MNTMRPRRLCPVCGSTECVSLHEQRFILPEGHPLTDGYAVVNCQTCGMVYADTSVTQAQFDEFYESCSKYEDQQTGTGGGGTAWDQQRLRDTAREIAKNFGRTARVLDIGCANGGLLGELRKSGFIHLCGVDPSTACVRNTAALGFESRRGNLTSLPEDLGKFDCVILSHVLEHVWDLRSSLEAVTNVLAGGGSVYAEVPDAARYHEFIFAPFQDFNTEHINHFSAACLITLFGRFGYQKTRGGCKEIASSADSLTPAIFGFYSKSKGTRAPVIKDSDLRDAIQLYISGSRRLMDEIDSHLTRALAGNSGVLVWGTGQLTMKLLSETVLRNHTIAAFVDGNPINYGKVLRGVRVLSPRELQEGGWGQPIVIGSLLHGKEIIRGIRERYGLANACIELRS